MPTVSTSGGLVLLNGGAVRCGCCNNLCHPQVEVVFATIYKACNASPCGALPCVSGGEASFLPGGYCFNFRTECFPDYNNLTRAEKCAQKRYSKVEYYDLVGVEPYAESNESLGRTQTLTYSMNEDNQCLGFSANCSGSRTKTTTFSGTEGDQVCQGQTNYSVEETVTYEPNCGRSISYKCSGNSYRTCNSEQFASLNYTCNSTLSSDCNWSGTYTYADGSTEPTDRYCVYPDDPSVSVYNPPHSCVLNVTYSEPMPALCYPTTWKNYPLFEACGATPQYELGQSAANSAYKFVDPHDDSIQTEQRFKYRVVHTGYCYLKVWFRKVTQKYKFEDCDTGFPGDPPRTAPLTGIIDCNAQYGNIPDTNCFSRWSTDGEPIIEADGVYEWDQESLPCSCDCEGAPSEKTVIPASNESVFIQYKYITQKGQAEPPWPPI